MRIAVMLRYLMHQRGGIGTYTKSLLEYLLRLDSDNEYVLLYRDEALLDSYGRIPNVREMVIPAKSALSWDQLAIVSVAKKEKFDLVFNPKLAVPLLAPCKTVFTLAGADWFVFPQNYKLHDRIYHRMFAPLYCHRADAVISISNNATEEILKRVRVAPEKLRTIYLGVDKDFRPINDSGLIDCVRAKYHLPDEFILYVGQIYPMKNFGGIVRSFAKVKRQLPHKLVVVGKPSLKYRRELALIDQLGLRDDVVMAGWVPDAELPVFYNLASVFLFPSFYEGFGIPLIEAMACGCPVVTSTGGSCPEVAGDAAVIVDPHDIDSIAKGVMKVIGDTTCRNNLIEQGLERAKSFTWETTAAETLALFREVAAT